jgi:hydrogenase expression/formation protein HypD
LKYLSEYRDSAVAGRYLAELRSVVTRPWTIMEVCGGQTHSLVRNGILDLLPAGITMVHGPGCPVCVTPVSLIDKAIHIAGMENAILCSFGDMLRVPGSNKSLLQCKAGGADVRIMYSPLEAVKLAADRPDKEVVFFAVGFETTAPANALSVLHAQRAGLENYSILTSHVLVPPAIRAVMEDPMSHIQAFLAAGHVCTIMGMEEYQPLTSKYKIPIVITGFEPVDLLQGILMAVRQLEAGKAEVENQYARVVRDEGNPAARQMIREVFRISDRDWRGIGTIPESGFELNADFSFYDAGRRFKFPDSEARENEECIAGEVLKGIKKPADCPQFGKHCTPSRPLGAPMVSSEGACAAYYQYTSLGAENR